MKRVVYTSEGDEKNFRLGEYRGHEECVYFYKNCTGGDGQVNDDCADVLWELAITGRERQLIDALLNQRFALCTASGTVPSQEMRSLHEKLQEES